MTSLKVFYKSLRKRLNINNLSYLPRWIILVIDYLMCFTAYIITYYIINNISYEIKFNETLSFIERANVILAVNGFFFLGFKTYHGLIRHSTFHDALKLMGASISTIIILTAINYVSFFVFGKKIFLMPSLAIYFFISFMFLFLFRAVVKELFEVFLKISRRAKKLKVLILGIESNAVSIASALKAENPSRFEVLGFIDKDRKNVGKRILGLPIIFSKNKTSTIIKSRGASGIIMADKEISLSERNTIIEDCLEYRFKIFKAPLVSSIEDENVSNKIESIQIEDILERKQIVLDKFAISKKINTKRVLVTGGAGSIGSEIVRQVALYNPEIIYVLDQAETPLHDIHLELQANFPNLNFKTVLADVRNKAKMEAVFNEYVPNIVYHAAAYKHVPLMENNPSEASFVNIKGTKNVADLSLEHGVEKFVFISTDKAVNPSNIMGASKRIAEMYVQSLYYSTNGSKKKSTKFITTRFGNVLGSNGSVVPLFKKQIAKGGPITITHPEITRYFMTISEACQLVLEAGARGNGGEIFIFDMGEAVKIMDLATKMIRLAGYIPDKDIKIKITGLRPGEKLYEELLSNKSTTLPTHFNKIMIAKEVTEGYLRVNQAVEKIISLSETNNIKEMVQSMKSLVPEFKSMNSGYEKLDKEIPVKNIRVV